jgi:hypothetical protein
MNNEKCKEPELAIQIQITKNEEGEQKSCKYKVKCHVLTNWQRLKTLIIPREAGTSQTNSESWHKVCGGQFGHEVLIPCVRATHYRKNCRKSIRAVTRNSRGAPTNLYSAAVTCTEILTKANQLNQL